MLDHSVKEVTMKVRFFYEESFIVFFFSPFVDVRIFLFDDRNVSGGQLLPLLQPYFQLPGVRKQH
jgi:hypothetical protein